MGEIKKISESKESERLTESDEAAYDDIRLYRRINNNLSWFVGVDLSLRVFWESYKGERDMGILREFL